MTPEQLSVIAGTVLSLFFSFFPGAKTWFETLTPDKKRLVMLGFLFGVTAVIFGLSCANLYNYFMCTWQGAWDALKLFILAAMANQAAYQLTPGVHENSK